MTRRSARLAVLAAGLLAATVTLSAQHHQPRPRPVPAPAAEPGVDAAVGTEVAAVALLSADDADLVDTDQAMTP